MFNKDKLTGGTEQAKQQQQQNQSPKRRAQLCPPLGNRAASPCGSTALSQRQHRSSAYAIVRQLSSFGRIHRVEGAPNGSGSRDWERCDDAILLPASPFRCIGLRGIARAASQAKQQSEHEHPGAVSAHIG